ncbi:MAG: hypothetical protein OXU64_09830 [Gemmatimonadota bacterium]|nr:hypothetical protein [Gemmatimonadota bacterium]
MRRIVLVLMLFPTAPPAAAQQRARVAQVTPEVACRVAPSHSANVAAVLELKGNAWAAEIWVWRTATDERGETWIHIAPSLTSRPWVAEGCWVAESMVVSTEGAGHLLELADRLLSEDALPPLEHLLAVHTLFVHSRYREQVEGSPVFSLRRAALAAKAVEAAQRTELTPLRPTDRDPRIIMWIESLGDRVRYSENPSGWGMWTVDEGGPRTGAGPGEPGRDERAPAPEARDLAIIAPDVACRIRPLPTASGPRTLRLDLHFGTDRADTIVAGEAWVFYPPGKCWVVAAHTAPGDTDQHVLAMADRFLTSGEGWSTFNHLSLLTVLSVYGRGHRDIVEGSAVLGLRRLELLRRVLGEYRPRSADAVTLAWIEALGSEISYTAEGSAWTLSDEAYLTLYDSHRADPFAEEIIWRFASESDAYSCEDDPVCHAEQAVNERLARYWAEFPSGRHIARAIELGRTAFGYALEQCSAARAAGPDSRAARDWEWYGWDDRGPEIVRVLRASLEEVSEEDRAPLIERLGELEECAAGR